MQTENTQKTTFEAKAWSSSDHSKKDKLFKYRKICDKEREAATSD